MVNRDGRSVKADGNVIRFAVAAKVQLVESRIDKVAPVVFNVLPLRVEHCWSSLSCRYEYSVQSSRDSRDAIGSRSRISQHLPRICSDLY